MNSEVSPPITLSSPDTRDSKRRRAPAACTVCHRRKVRCNAAVTIPCANCVQDGEECVLHISGRGKHKRVKVQKQEDQRTLPSNISSGIPPLPYGTSHLSAGLAQESFMRHQARPQSPPRAGPATASTLSTISPVAPVLEEEDGGENVEAYKHIVDPPTAKGPSVPFYVGESQCLRFIFNVAKDSALASNAHFWVERPARTRLAPEDLQFLEAKGSFSLPPEPLCRELLELYFNYVHPLLPVVDAANFLTQYEQGGPSNVCLLLLQSMLFAASSFAGPDLLSHFGVTSIKALKKQFYQRAKALYDIDYEIDKIPLIQAVLLMGYWYGNTHDRADSWHWVGIATSLSQTLGFHHSPGRSSIPEAQRRLWKRLWWCCAHRDSWISLGMGRPTRINKEDCDVERLTVHDLVDPNSTSHLSEKSRVLVERCNSLAPLFVELAKLSSQLGDILLYQYAAGSPRKSLEGVQILEEDLQRWYSDLDQRFKIDLALPINQEDRVTTIHTHMLQIFFQVTVITLHRPLIFQSYDRLYYPEGKTPSDSAFDKCIFAASVATDSYRRLIDCDLTKRLPPESVTLFISITTILFLEKFSAVGLKRNMASQKLDLCMMVIEELVEKYWAARFITKYFRAAFEKIESAARGQASRDASRTPMPRTAPLGVQDLMNRTDQAIGQPYTPPPSDSTLINSTFSPDMMLNDLGFIFEAADLFNMLE